jgi:hypothetical protein
VPALLQLRQQPLGLLLAPNGMQRGWLSSHGRWWQQQLLPSSSGGSSSASGWLLLC